jgi:beta-ribofuranosylaminobenzene 5'-phosphate synthase
MRVEVKHNGFEIYRQMNCSARRASSSWGVSTVWLSIAIVTDSSREEVAKLMAPPGLEIAIETEVDNEWLKMVYQ